MKHVCIYFCISEITVHNGQQALCEVDSEESWAVPQTIYVCRPRPPGLIGRGVVEASHHPGPVHQQVYSVKQQGNIPGQEEGVRFSLSDQDGPQLPQRRQGIVGVM